MQEVLENNKRSFSKSKRVSTIDFNCDLAQGFGIYKNDKEYEFLDYVSSVNISAGFHAGDPLTIREAFLKAKEKNVVIGANIGFDDIQGFGMRAVNLSEDEIEALVVYQVGAMMSFAKAYGVEVEFVRTHGAMYRLAGEDYNFSSNVAKAIKKCSKWLSYVGSAGDVLSRVSEDVKISIVKEYELNKNYTPAGVIDYSLSIIENPDVLSKRLHRYLQYSQIENIQRGTNYVEADTIHFSNDAVSLRLLKEASAMITPVPVTYSRVKESGWV